MSKEDIIELIEDKQYALDKILVVKMHKGNYSKLEKLTLEIEIALLSKLLKKYYE